MGYATWADYITEVKMVKNAKGVFEFLNDLEQKLRPVATKEREILLAMKQKDCKESGIAFDGKLNIWDYRYYDRKFVEESLDLDDMLVKEYFPVSVVVPAILDIYQTLLGVKFVEVKGETWHPGDANDQTSPNSYNSHFHFYDRGPTIRRMGERRKGRVWLCRLLLPRPFPSR